MKKEYWIYLFIFLACVASRYLSAVSFPEDPESFLYLRHIAFPYTQWKEFYFAPLYINEIKVLVLLMPVTTAIALAGGIATFVLILASLKLSGEPVYRVRGIVLTLLIFFNPLIWIFGNRGTVELTAAALLMSVIALGLRSKSKTEVYLFWIIVGLLPFFKLLYGVLALPVIIYMVLDGKEKRKSFWVGVTVIAMCLLMIIVMDGGLHLDPNSAEYMQDQFWMEKNKVLFTEATDVDTMTKAKLFFQTVWANAAGGWWSDRPFWLWLPTLVVIFPVIYFLYSKTFFNSSIKEYIILVGGLVYAGVIFIFRDVNTFQGDVLPLIPLFLIMTVLGIQNIATQLNAKVVYAITALGLLLYGLNTYQLVKEHKSGLTSYQLGQYVPENEAYPLMFSSVSMYAIFSGVVDQYAASFLIDYKYDDRRPGICYLATEKNIPEELSKLYIATPVKVFTHNAYVNPVWTSVTLYKLEKRK